jgi:alpha-ketoglutarate-dependent taurine dioxygenase
MQKRRPDLVPLLFDPIATDRRGEIPEGQKPYFEIPVLNWHRGHLTGMYQRQYIDSAQRFPDAMRLTDRHVEALDLFDSLANDPKLHLVMRLKPGDLQFVYNHSMLHDRMGFLDWAEPEKRRHMMRLWLSVPDDRPLPECFKQRYGSIEIGDRGGIITSDTRLNAPLG